MPANKRTKSTSTRKASNPDTARQKKIKAQQNMERKRAIARATIAARKKKKK